MARRLHDVDPITQDIPRSAPRPTPAPGAHYPLRIAHREEFAVAYDPANDTFYSQLVDASAPLTKTRTTETSSTAVAVNWLQTHRPRVPELFVPYLLLSAPTRPPSVLVGLRSLFLLRSQVAGEPFIARVELALLVASPRYFDHRRRAGPVQRVDYPSRRDVETKNTAYYIRDCLVYGLICPTP